MAKKVLYNYIEYIPTEGYIYMKKNASRLLCSGLFATVCHMCFILLFYNFNASSTPQALLISRCAEMLEYSLMSIVILCIGGLALDMVN